MSKKFEPIKIIKTLQDMPTKEWQLELNKYTKEDLIAITGVLMVNLFFVRSALPKILKVI